MGQSIVTSRSVPQHTVQMFSPFAGQNRPSFLFSQIGQGKRNSPDASHGRIPCRPANAKSLESGHDDFVMEAASRDDQKQSANDAKSESIFPKMNDSAPRRMMPRVM